VRLLSEDCPDPPCHEVIDIPADAQGAEVLIIARDTFGKIERRVFKVEGKEAGGLMA
jgi:hypothetical protein